MPHEKLIRLLNFLWLLLVFPAVVAVLVGFLGHGATLGFKTFLLTESGVAILSPLLTAILGSRDTYYRTTEADHKIHGERDDGAVDSAHAHDWEDRF
jgi:hypothetical protein